MEIIRETKNILVLRGIFKRNYLIGLVLSFLGLFSLLTRIFYNNDNYPVIVLSLIIFLIGITFISLSGIKEIYIDKSKGQLKIKYFRYLYNHEKKYKISDIEKIVYKIKSNKAFVGTSYHYYLKIRQGPLVFFASQELQVLSTLKSAVKKKKEKNPEIVDKVAKFLDIKVNKKKGLYF